MVPLLVRLTLLLGLAAAASAGARPASGEQARKVSTAPAACASDERHQLDFWLGDWNVFDTAKGNPVGQSHIASVMSGCAIRESYEAPDGAGGTYAGTSYSSFDRKDGKWHQFYVDVNGNASWFTGEAVGKDLTLLGTVRPGVLQKMTYHQNDDGSVRQSAVISVDEGKSWRPGYDLTYRPASTSKK